MAGISRAYKRRGNMVAMTGAPVLCLDAGSKISYPATGTTWTDLSGNGNTGTLVNGPTYSSANGGSIVFDGVNDHGTIPFTNNILTFGTSDFSVGIWLFVSTASARTILTNYNAYNSGYGSYFYIAQYNSNRVVLLNSDGNFFAGELECGITNNIWTKVVFTRSGNTFSCYKNGIIVKSFSKSGVNYSGSGRPVLLGGGLPDDATLSGRLSGVTIYNRALSAAEISTNFELTRGRYGI